MKPVWGQKSWGRGLPRAEDREAGGPQGMTEPAPPPLVPPGMPRLRKRGCPDFPTTGQKTGSTGCRSKDPHQLTPTTAALLTLKETSWTGHGRALLPRGTGCVQAGEGREYDSAHSVVRSLGRLRTGWSIRGTQSERGSGQTELPGKIQDAHLNSHFR